MVMADENAYVDYFRSITNHLFQEVKELSHFNDDWFYRSIPPFFEARGMIPKPPDFKPEPIPDLVTLRNYYGRACRDKGQIVKELKPASKNMCFSPQEAKEITNVIMMYQDCLIGTCASQVALESFLPLNVLPNSKEAQQRASASSASSDDPSGGLSPRQKSTNFKANRLFRSTFCRFLLDLEIVDMDGKVCFETPSKPKSGSNTKCGFVYCCNLFDAAADYDAVKIQRSGKSSPGGHNKNTTENNDAVSFVNTISITEEFVLHCY